MKSVIRIIYTTLFLTLILTCNVVNAVEGKNLDNCKDKKQVSDYALDDSSYSGFICDGVPEGKGIKTFKNGAVQEGEFSKGLLNGFVTTEFPNKGHATGYFLNGKRHGKTTLYRINARTYEKFYRNGKLVEGINSTDMYVSYNGERNDIGQKHGYGIGTYRGGDIYEGHWLKGTPEGKGVYRWVNAKSFYSGSFINHNYDGYGIKFIFDRSLYEGDWKEGKEHGEGVKYYIGGFTPEINRCFYKGKFKNGFPVGERDCSRKKDKEFWESLNNTKVISPSEIGN